MQITELFPIPVAQFDLEPITAEQLAWLAGQEWVHNPSNRITVNKNLLDAEIMAPLRRQIDECMEEYRRKFISTSPEFSVEITQSWCNFAQQGEGHHMHSHPNSVVSGSYYPQTMDGDALEFTRIAALNSPYRVPVLPEDINEWNCRTVRIHAKQNSLLLFPSDVLHSAPPREHNIGSERISLALNSFYKGRIGDYNDVTELHIS
jgi:uncharacterized protein (TIGR02466 family)